MPRLSWQMNGMLYYQVATELSSKALIVSNLVLVWWKWKIFLEYWLNPQHCNLCVHSFIPTTNTDSFFITFPNNFEMIEYLTREKDKHQGEVRKCSASCASCCIWTPRANKNNGGNKNKIQVLTVEWESHPVMGGWSPPLRSWTAWRHRRLRTPAGWGRGGNDWACPWQRGSAGAAPCTDPTLSERGAGAAEKRQERQERRWDFSSLWCVSIKPPPLKVYHTHTRFSCTQTELPVWKCRS